MPAGSKLKSLRRIYRQKVIGAALRRESGKGQEQGLHVVHMLHVRKTGGTAVKQALESADQPADLRLLLHGHSISLDKLPRNDDVFFFLREPVSRYVSGFEMRRREGRPRHYSPWTADERRAFARFKTADDLAVALRASDATERAEAERAMRSIYHVRSRLTDWLVDEREVRTRRDHLIFIGWQERLDADFATLVALLGLAPSTRLSDDEFVANKAVGDEQQQKLSGEAVETIRAWYAEDYRLIALLTDLGLTDPPSEVAAILGELVSSR